MLRIHGLCDSPSNEYYYLSGIELFVPPPGCGQRQTADPVGFGLTIPSTGRKSIGLKHPLDVIRGLDYVFTRYALDFMLGAVLAGRKPQQPSWRAPAGPQRSPTAILRLSIKFTQSIWKLFWRRRAGDRAPGRHLGIKAQVALASAPKPPPSTPT